MIRYSHKLISKPNFEINFHNPAKYYEKWHGRSLSSQLEAHRKIVDPLALCTVILIYISLPSFPIGTSAFYKTLDPIKYILPVYDNEPFVQFYLKYISPAFFAIHFANGLSIVVPQPFITILMTLKVGLVLLTVVAAMKSRIQATPTFFSGALRKYQLLLICTRIHCEIRSKIHSVWGASEYLLLVLTGTATILGPEYMGLSTAMYPVYPMLFVVLLSVFFTSIPVCALFTEMSEIFKHLFQIRLRHGRVSRTERATFTRQLDACRNLAIHFGFMGFADRSFIMTYIDGVFHNIVDLILFIKR